MNEYTSVRPDDDVNGGYYSNKVLSLTSWRLSDTGISRESKGGYYAKRIKEIMSSPEEDD